MENNLLSGKTIVLGIAGGVAAYKSAEICSSLVKAGASVHVVMTEHAMQFVGPVTFRAITGRQVITGLWDEPREYEITHVALPDKADLVLVAPATANILGKVASGVADDMLSTMLLATTAPVIFAPAMNCKMWRHPVVQGNVERLKSIGCQFVGPVEGRLACGVEDIGRLAAPETIVQAVLDRIGRTQDLKDTTVLVTAGPTQEPIDPVRFIANRSSGKMGYAIAQAAADRGAQVILVSGPGYLPAPAGVDLVCVETAAQMLDAVLNRLPEARVIIVAAAVADYTPKVLESSKIKKSDFGLVLELEPTKDIVAEVGHRKGDRVLVGFAAETENLLEHAKAKLESKNMDFVVANDVSRSDIGFGSEYNEVAIIAADGSVQELPRLSKSEVANRILDRVKGVLPSHRS